MNIGENQNSEFIKLQPVQEVTQTPNVAVVNGDTNGNFGGGFLSDKDFLGNNKTFLDELNTISNNKFNSNQDGMFSFGIMDFQPLDSFKDDDFSSIESIESCKVSEEDAKFFVNLINHKELNFQNLGDNTSIVQGNEKTVEVSKTILNMLQKTSTEGKPLRLDFDNNITLVLKLGQNGQINANFYPSDKSAEEYLRNNIPYLRQEFDLKNISYGSLNYFSQNRKQNKENNNE